MRYTDIMIEKTLDDSEKRKSGEHYISIIESLAPGLQYKAFLTHSHE